MLRQSEWRLHVVSFIPLWRVERREQIGGKV
jgi:hypothetical protein